VTGTPPSAPTGVGVLTAPNLVDVGKAATVTAIAVAGPNPFPGVPVTFQAVQGKVTFTGSTAGNRITVTTNASGQATATFVAQRCDADPTQRLHQRDAAIDHYRDSGEVAASVASPRRRGESGAQAPDPDQDERDTPRAIDCRAREHSLLRRWRR